MAKLNWTPWHGLTDANEELDRLIAEARGIDAMAALLEKGAVWTPAADMVETREGYLVHMELPGLSLEDVAVEIKGNQLWIYGKRPFRSDSPRAVFHVLERSYGPFARNFTLGESSFKPKDIRASLKDGILTVTVTKARPIHRKIKVK